MGPATCKIVGIKSMLSLFNQVRWGYGFSSRSTHTFNSAANPARRRGGVQCFLSMLFSGCRHRLEILTRPPAGIRSKPDGRFRQCLDINKAGSRWDSKHARRVRSWASSQRASSASALSEFLLPLDLLPFLLYLVFPFCAANKPSPTPSSACPR